MNKYDQVISKFVEEMHEERLKELTVSMNILQSPHTLVKKFGETSIIPI